MSQNHSPAEILRAALVQGGVGVLPDDSGAGVWPVYVGHLPATPDNAVCLYDTTGFKEGRDQRSGQTLAKPGWQIRVRGTTHTIGYGQMLLVQAYLDSVLRLDVRVDGTTYHVQAVIQVGTVISLGQEPEGLRRCEFTLNGTITFTVA